MMPALHKPDVRELVSNVELIGVKYLQISGQAKPQEEEPRPETEDISSADVHFSVQESHGPAAIEVRFKVHVDHPQAQYDVELATRYASQVEYDLEQDVVRDFIEKVAVMAAFPYVREAISSMAARLELEVPILGVLRQGEFSLGPAASSS